MRKVLKKRPRAIRDNGEPVRNIGMEPLCHKTFNGFILKRVVGLHDDPSASVQMHGKLRECPCKLVQFAVYFNTQGLENPLSRVPGSAVGARDRIVYKPAELAGRYDIAVFPAILHNSRCNQRAVAHPAGTGPEYLLQ